MSAEAAETSASTETAETLRTCRTCRVPKPLLTAFRPQVKGGRTYHRWNCRECDKAGHREYYRERADASLAAVLPLGEFATQICRECNQQFPFSEFRRTPETRLGISKKCKVCERKYSRQWVKDNPDVAYNSYLLRTFGISLAQYNEILAGQGGVCAICGEPPDGPRNMRRGGRNVFKARLVVDHDHGTGKVRGLLCNNCNAAIGMLKDDPALVRDALGYLERAQ